jgi:hypothetical protein
MPSITSLTDARQFDMVRRWGGQLEEDGRGSYRARAGTGFEWYGLSVDE